VGEAIRASGLDRIEEEIAATPRESEQKRYTRLAHSAVFVEVKVDEALGTIDVARVVSAIAGGRILNPRTARSQIVGAVVWGIGMALEEQSVIDQSLGRFMTHNLAEYLIPVNADVHDIDVIFVEEHDPIVNPLGVKGLGEIGLVGVAAAIANAVFHATGNASGIYPSRSTSCSEAASSSSRKPLHGSKEGCRGKLYSSIPPDEVRYRNAWREGHHQRHRG
jgi:xanthine dehydrogenase YagR molybdenum-binding subunit